MSNWFLTQDSRSMGLWLPAAITLCIATVWCGPAPPVSGAAAHESVVSAPARQDFEDRPRIVVLGDSLTAGLGLPASEAYPGKLQERLNLAGYQFQVVAAGVSGDTTAGGLRRLQWALEGDVRILIIALGGNDGLRGLPVEQMKDNLSQIVTTALDRKIGVMLAGMEAPPNYGSLYTERFRNVFREIGSEYDVVLVPFLLEGVAGHPNLNQRDGIHPNAEGATMVAAHVWSSLKTMLPAVVAEVN